MLINHPYTINANHNGKANDKFITIWLVLVKIYGKRPSKLLNIIMENNEIKINVLPLYGEFIRILNSMCSLLIISIHKRFNRDGINQNIDGINIKPINVLVQFNDKLKVEVAGSNTENRLVIIFNLLNFFCY